MSAADPTAVSPYLLGDSAEERARLDTQHLLWRDTLLPRLRASGLVRGARVLEVGCGTGSLLADLAEVVGPEGEVMGIDQSTASLAHARARLGGQVQLVEGDLRTADLGTGWDLIVARWVLSFLSDPEQVVARLAAALRPGGCLVLQDYHHEGISAWPASEPLALGVRAARDAYRSRGGDLFVAGRFPALIRAAGLHLETLEPHARASTPGSGAFAWVDGFVCQHAPSWRDEGHLTEAELKLVLEGLADLRRQPDAVIFSPLVVTAVGRRP